MSTPTGPCLERNCQRCDYPLRGVTETDACPECGLPVADSLRSGLIDLKDTACLIRIKSGLRLLLGSLLVVVLYPLLIFTFGALGGYGGENLELLLLLVWIGMSVLMTVFWCVGLFRATASSTSPTWRRMLFYRRAARTAAVVETVGMVVHLGIYLAAVMASSLGLVIFGASGTLLMLLARTSGLLALAKWIPEIDKLLQWERIQSVSLGGFARLGAVGGVLVLMAVAGGFMSGFAIRLGLDWAVYLSAVAGGLGVLCIWFSSVLGCVGLSWAYRGVRKLIEHDGDPERLH